MKEFIKNIIQSLNNDSSGFSGKKLTAVTIVACIFVAHIKWITLGDFSQLISVLTVDYGFVALLFGINVADKKLNDNKEKE
jgi:hypothetical protein